MILANKNLDTLGDFLRYFRQKKNGININMKIPKAKLFSGSCFIPQKVASPKHCFFPLLQPKQK